MSKCQKIDACKFRDQLILQDLPTDLSGNGDGMGGFDPIVPVNLVTFWCELKPISANQRLYAQRLEHNITHKVIARYDSRFIESTEKRLSTVDGSRIFQIQSVINIDEMDLFVEFTVVEGVAT